MTSVVWFKRDFRLHDHAPLTQATQEGPVLCVYAIEPTLWLAPDAACQHFQFILESAVELDRQLQRRGGRLHLLWGEMPALLERLKAHIPVFKLFSHEETGNDLSYARDQAVARWCKTNSVAWTQTPQFGVVRRLKNRNLWKGCWDAHVALPCLPVPDLAPSSFAPLPWAEPAVPGAQDLALDVVCPPKRQLGGRRLGLSVLQSFLQDRSGQYRGGISSPLSAPSACSRLSPYLAYGCLSLREIVQATVRQYARLPPEVAAQKKGLSAFMSRLYWHCHFIQKLESEPELEWRNVHRGYDGLREPDWNPVHFDALIAGRTGWPMVDACVAMLRETGWLNFRMRAMLVSVAAYPLWLHWQLVGQWLARQFLDYEPGIHWSQMQMQSGTTGINIPRVYNPVKQARDHDPHGHFVRRWLPALRKVPDAWLFEPWRMPPDLQAHYGLQPGDIAQPLVDLDVATRQAKARLFALKALPEVRAAKSAIVEKHGSRKRMATQAKSKAKPSPASPKTAAPSAQLGLDF
jgi:deoxyribodipyrimidine photo-lyase